MEFWLFHVCDYKKCVYMCLCVLTYTLHSGNRRLLIFAYFFDHKNILSVYKV